MSLKAREDQEEEEEAPLDDTKLFKTRKKGKQENQNKKRMKTTKNRWFVRRTHLTPCNRCCYC